MKRILLACISALLLCALGCGRKADTYETALFAMDTYCTIEAYGKGAEAAAASAAGELKRLDALFSIGLPDSDTARINAAGGGPVRMAKDTAALIDTALAVSAETGGAFDISIGPVVRLWGFYDEVQRVPAEDAVRAALSKVDYRRLALDGMYLHTGAGQSLDFGGVAKGYAADRMAEVLTASGAEGALISLGGNVQAVGARPDGAPWRIAVRDPFDEDAVLGVVEAMDCAVVTAGSYQRYFEAEGRRYHHIIDPRTGYPAESGLVSVTVIADSGARADALSTALFVLGPERAAAAWRSAGDFDMILITDRHEIYYSGACFTPLATSIILS